MFNLPITLDRFYVKNSGSDPLILFDSPTEPKGYGHSWLIPPGGKVEIYGKLRFFDPVAGTMGRLWFVGNEGDVVIAPM